MTPGELVRVGQARLRGVAGRAPWWLGLPIVPFQGYRLIRTLPRFADADGVTGRVGFGDRRMKVVVLGDSVTAGYAVGHHRSSVAGQLAVRLAGLPHMKGGLVVQNHHLGGPPSRIIDAPGIGLKALLRGRAPLEP